MDHRNGTSTHGRWTWRVLVVAVVLLMLLGPATVTAFPSWGDASVGVTSYHRLTMMQGDDPNSPEVEPRDQVAVVDRTLWSIPWNSSEIYTYIPPEARNVSVDNIKAISHQGTSIFIPGDYSKVTNPDDPPAMGWKEGSGNEGFYFWRFPNDVSRDQLANLTFSSSADFNDADPNMTKTEEWNVSDGSLSLAENVSEAIYVSKRYTGGVNIVTVNMTFGAEHGQNMTFDVSIDNGTTWYTTSPGIPLPLDDIGGEFRWRVTMTQNLSHNATPLLYGVTFELKYTPEYTDIWIEARYTLDILEGELVIDQLYPFDSTISTFVYVGYIDLDMDLQVNGTEVIRSEGGDYPGKATYTHMTGGHEPVLTFTITDTTTDDGQDDDPTYYWFYIVVSIMVLVMVIGIAMVLTSDRRRKTEARELRRPVDGDGPGEDEDLEDLTERKAELVDAIRVLDEDHEIGLIDDGKYELHREELKAEAVEVIKRIEDGN